MSKKKRRDIYIATWGKSKRYVYYNKIIKKRVTASYKSFKNIRDFRNYIIEKRFLFNVKEGKITEFKENYALTSDKIIKRKYITHFYVLAIYKDYSASSGVFKIPITKRKIKEAKDNALFNLMAQVVYIGDRGYLAGSYSDDIDYDFIESKMQDIDESKIKYKYIFYRDKK